MNPTIEAPTNSSGGRHRVRSTAVATNSMILAKDIMTTPVVVVEADATVSQIAQLLAEKHISAVPVVDHGALLGIVSEADLIRRQELGTASARGVVSTDHAKVHGTHARDVMTRDVLTVSEDSALPEIAKTLEAGHIRRVLVMRGAKLVGVISRANIVRALAARPPGSPGPVSSDDDMILYRVLETLMGIPGASPWLTTVTVSNGIVQLHGCIEDEAARDPSRIAVERLPYVVEVKDFRAVMQPY